MPIVKADNELRVYQCSMWDDFVSRVKQARVQNNGKGGFSRPTHVFFRGHSDPTWLLSASAERNLTLTQMEKQETDVVHPHLRMENGVDWYISECNELLARFSQTAHGLSELPENHPDSWITGRHYGLLSPYLDWTSSPFVAAFFALQKLYEKLQCFRSSYTPGCPPCTIWAICLWKEAAEKDIFEYWEPRTVHGSRARAQRGAFTKLLSENYIDILSYFKSRGIAHYLERYDLCLNDGERALMDLELMNINYSSLFPDIMGAAQDANLERRFLGLRELSETAHNSETNSGAVGF